MRDKKQNGCFEKLNQHKIFKKKKSKCTAGKNFEIIKIKKKKKNEKKFIIFFFEYEQWLYIHNSDCRRSFLFTFFTGLPNLALFLSIRLGFLVKFSSLVLCNEFYLNRFCEVRFWTTNLGKAMNSLFP